MKRSEAAHVMKILVAGFPREAIEPETAALWIREFDSLESPVAAAEAAVTIVRSGDRFPTIREFRQAYRATARLLAPPALEEGPREPMPVDARTWLERNVPAAAALEVTEKIKPRPVWARWERRRRFEPMLPPTDEEKHDAILVLRDGTDATGVPLELLREAERIVHEGSA